MKLQDVYEWNLFCESSSFCIAIYIAIIDSEVCAASCCNSSMWTTWRVFFMLKFYVNLSITFAKNQHLVDELDDTLWVSSRYSRQKYPF